MLPEDALLQPPGGGNYANWILGHLVNLHNELARVLGVEPVWEDPRLAGAGAEPITNADEAIDWEGLVARFAAGEAWIARGLEALTEEELAAVIPTPAFGDTPRGIFLATVLFHRACHTGQLAMARRLAGPSGAIRIPGTEQGEAGGGRGEGMGMVISSPGRTPLLSFPTSLTQGSGSFSHEHDPG